MSFLPSLSPGNVKQRLPTALKFDNDLRWTRPTEWLDLGITAAYGDSGVPEKIKGLVAVYPNDIAPAHNYVAFHLDTTDGSTYTVNWGDGTTETLAHNTTHHHIYDYDAITSDTSTAKATPFRGYKQAIFEITLAGSAKFSQITFEVDGPFTTFTSQTYRKGAPILDLFVSSSGCTNIVTSYTRPLFLCEQIEVRNTSSNRITTGNQLYVGAKNLESIPFVPWVYNSGSRSYYICFQQCMSLKFLPDEFASQDKFWFKNISNMQQTFDNCINLQYLPEGLFGNSIQTSCSTFYLTFRSCEKLKYIPYLGMRTGSGSDTRMDYMFQYCYALKAIPKGFSAQRCQPNSSGTSHGLRYIFLACRNVKDWSSVFDGASDWLGSINSTSNTFTMQDSFAGWGNLLEFPYIGQFTKASYTYGTFRGSKSIVRFHPSYTYLDLSNSTTMALLFRSCDSLRELPELKVRSLTYNNSTNQTFYDCRSLTHIKMTGMIAGAANGEYYMCFYRCSSLTCIDGMDFSFATETSDYYQMFHICRNINAIKFPGTFRAGYASPRINVTVANHADISGEYHIEVGFSNTRYAQASGNGVLTVAESGGNYTWTIADDSDGDPLEYSSASSSTQFTPWAADWSGATNAVTFSEVMTGFKYTVSGGSGDGLRYSPIKRAQMLEIFNQLATVSYTATLDIRNNSYTSDLTDADKAIATNKGWTLSL